MSENTQPMRAIPEGFPHKLTDEALDETIERMLKSAPAGFPPFVTVLPELQLAIIVTGIQEQSRRAAGKAEKRALWVAVAAFAVSLASLVTALLV